MHSTCLLLLFIPTPLAVRAEQLGQLQAQDRRWALCSGADCSQPTRPLLQLHLRAGLASLSLLLRYSLLHVCIV